ncbi:MAG TPA: PaaI family thioesterase [Chitinispirillaceae bacterium]|nr:PaaI family thioesterase [Chitinispirillaceae bacterium]
MRPLIAEIVEPDTPVAVFDRTGNSENRQHGTLKYEQKLAELKAKHHSQCLFNRQPSIVPGLKFWFDDTGIFYGSFHCNAYQQGYDTMVHGGVIAAVIDSSMAQCLMGHGVVGYTANLSVKYRKPVAIGTDTMLQTSIVAVNCGVLYLMVCKITQNDVCVVKADGKFFKVK